MVVEWKFLEDGTMKVKSPVWDEEQILPDYIANAFKTREMLRTQDITQNGYSVIDMPNLKGNTRWGHHIMVIQLMHPFFSEVKSILEENDTEVDNEEFEIAEVVFASHDTGHTDNSHQSEGILKYSHEQRTIDILLGDGELGRLLCSQYPREKVERVVQIITNIDINQGVVPEEELSPLLQIYAQLICSGGDLDKTAYTIGDTTYAGVKSSLNPKKLLDSFGIGIDANGKYILNWEEEGQRQLEILDIERFQNYRDMYFTPSAEIMRNMEPVMLELVDQEPEEIKRKLPEPFLNKIAASKSDSHITTLEQELQMTDTPMDEAWKILSQEAKNPILRYLADMQGSRQDYYFFESQRDISEILAQLQEVFPSKDLSKTNSLFDVVSKCKMIKPTEDPWIRMKNGDLRKASEKAGCLIKPENFVRRRVYFNPELLRLELNMSKEQFANYRTMIDWSLDEIDQKEEEFQAKYISKDGSMTIEEFIAFMEQQGFDLEGEKDEHNEDDYLETRDFDLLKSGREFIVRTNSSTSGSSKSYINYKETISEGEFTHKRSIKTPVKSEGTIEEMKTSIEHRTGTKLGLERKPFMHISTSRKQLLFRRKGKKISVSWDEDTYENKWLHESASEVMLKIAARGENPDRLILKRIQQIMKEKSGSFEPYSGSKINRGTLLTYRKIKQRDSEIQEASEIDQQGQTQSARSTFREALRVIVNGSIITETAGESERPKSVPCLEEQ